MLQQILYTACVTPFDATGRTIDYPSLERLLRLQEKAGNGVVLLGSTGESLSLTDAERRDIVTFTCNLNLKIQIIVGVPSYAMYAALEWLEFCQDLPIHGYLMTTPIYTKPGIMGQTKWFEKLLNKAAHPAILYNIPSRAGVQLHPKAVNNLQDHERFLMIKDCSGSATSVLEYKTAAPRVAVYCGDDYMMMDMAAAGATGLISIASNAWPEATRRYVKQSLIGETAGAHLWLQAGKALFTASNPIPIKALLKDIGTINYPTVRLPLCLEDLPSRQTLLDYHQEITNWGNKS